MSSYDPGAWSRNPAGYMVAPDQDFPAPSAEAESLLELIDPILDSCNSLLDVGCCEGRYYHWLKEYLCWDVFYVGCDITPAFLSLAIARFPGVEFHLQDVHALDFDDHSFDLVICPNVLMHLDGLVKPMSELFRVADKYVAISIYGIKHFKTEETHSDGFLNYWYPFDEIVAHCPKGWVVSGWIETVPTWDQSKLLYQILFERKR